MADSTYRVGVLLDLAAGRFRRGAKAAAQDTDRLGGSLRKAAGSGSLMGRNVAKGTGAARREVRRTTKDAQRLGGSLMKAGRSGSLMGRNVAEGTRGARREVQRTTQETQRLGHGLRRAGRDGERSMGRLARRLRGVRTEAGFAARAAGKLRGGIGLGAGVLGIAGSGFAIASGLKRVMTMEQRYARLEIAAGSTKDTIGALSKEIEATAGLPEVRLDASELLATVEAIVQRTGDLKFARDNLLTFAQVTQGYGGPGSGGAMGQIGSELRKLGIATEKEVADFFNLLAAQGTQGAFTLGNVATEGPRLFSAYSRLGYKGPDAGREMGALAQLSQMGTGSAPEATTAFEALLRTFSDANKGEAIWREYGVNVRDASGAFRAPSEIIKDVFEATGGDPTELSRVFDETAIRALPSTADALAKYLDILTMEAPPDAVAKAAARMAETSGAKVQEAKDDIDALMRDNLTGPVGEVVTALTSFKDELLVGVGLLAGSWFAFKGLRAAGNLLWRLAGRGGAPPGTPWPAAPPSPGRSPGGTGPTTQPSNAWRAAQRRLAQARAREAARIAREEAARRPATLTRTEAGGTGPTTRPTNAPTSLSPTWAGGLFRLLARGLGPASSGALMGLTAHDIATGAIPDDRVAPEVGGLAGGLAGSSVAGRAASSLMRSLPGPIRFGGSVLAGLGGFMGGDTAGRAATKAVFDPGWTSPESESAAQWILDLIPKHDPNAPPEIGNWRGVGLKQAPPTAYRRFNRHKPRTVPEWEPPLPPEREPSRNRGRLDIGRNESTVIKIESVIGSLTVHSGAADTREVAEEVADEIERRMRDRSSTLRDVVLASPSAEVEY